MNPVSLNSHTHASSLLSFPLLPAQPLWLPSPLPWRGSQHPHKTLGPLPCPLCSAASRGRVAAVLFQACNNKSFPLHSGPLQGQGAQSTHCPLFCQMHSLGVQDLGAFWVPGWGQVTPCIYSLITRVCHLWSGCWKSRTSHVLGTMLILGHRYPTGTS